MNIKIEFMPRPEFRALSTGDLWHGFPIVSSVPGSVQAIVGFPDDWDLDEIVDFLAEHEAEGEIVPDDARLEHTDYSGPDSDVAYPRVTAVGDTFGRHGINDDVLARGKAGMGILIAVIDTGVDVNHAAFKDVPVFGDLGGDRHGHGTHVASTALSPWGLAKKASLFVARALSDAGSGSESQVANAIRAAADAGADIGSMSLGGSLSQVIDDAVAYGASRGMIFAVAAGNNPSASIGSPARAVTPGRGVIVMACDRNDLPASFTSGRGWPQTNRVYFNGVSIDAARANSGVGVATMSGTSMATPQAAGALALNLSAGQTTAGAIGYMLGHRQNPPESPGKAFYLADFGEVVEPPLPPPPAKAYGLVVDFSFDRLTPALIATMKAAGVRGGIQCLWTGAGYPAYRVENLRTAQQNGFPMAAYYSVASAMSGSLHAWAARKDVPSDLWDALKFVAVGVELPGLSMSSHIENALAANLGYGKGPIIYTSLEKWVNLLHFTTHPANAWLWNAYGDKDPDIDFSGYAGWTKADLAGEQFHLDHNEFGMAVDLDMFWESLFPPLDPAPGPGPGPVPPPELVVAGIGVRFTDGTERQLWP